MTLVTGTKLGRYEIREQLGVGGMGEVYLAYDEELHRSIALKILLPEIAHDAQRMHRFIQEARSASALNHPNILTIHEVGKSDGLHFIATEFIDGENLREHFKHSRLRLSDLLDIATQIASALAKAHNSGIIHRDIKPENIMVTRDGYVKVLDFGLSKLTEQAAMYPEAPTQPFINTEPGKVMGTTRYMSPEQARGLDVDHRTDIWSLGVVLYEALTGHPPFEGNTTTDLIVSILEREPPPLSRFNSEVPNQFERIIRKTLAKDVEERYQVIKDLQIDLKNLKRELELEAEIDRTVPPEVRAAISTKSHPESAPETTQAPAVTTATASHQSVSSAEYVVSGIKKHKTAVLLGVVLMALAGGGFFFMKAWRKPVFTDKDTIVLADFTNTTGDNVFDGALKQALAVQLGQSPYLSIASDDRIRETLRFMGRSQNERLTRDVAREICLRQGIKALLAGSISTLGSNYVLSLEAVNAQTGEVFVREQIQATSKEEVLKALDTISSKLREKLGESLASIQKFGAPIEQATTSSLEALKLFSLGDEKRASGQYEEAIPLYKRASEIDPNFAIAYARLSAMHFNLRESERSAQYAEQAFALRDRVSEREKFYISANYYQIVSGDIEKAIETLELWKQTYPRDYVPMNNLAVNFALTGDFDKQLQAALESMKLNPNAASPFTNMSWAYVRLNRFDEAAQVIEQAKGQDKVSIGMRLSIYVVAYLRDDANTMKQQLDWASGKPAEAVLLRSQAAASFNSGRLTDAAQIRKRAIDLAQGRDQKELASRLQLDEAFSEAAVGNCEAASQAANTALTFVKGKEQQSQASLVLAFCGDAAKASSVIEDPAKRFPNDTEINAITLPLVRAFAELNKNPDKTIQLLEPVRRYEKGEFAMLFPVYLRGLAYMRLNRFREAAAEFQRVVEHRAVTFFFALHPLSELQLARAWAAATHDGDAAARENALVSARKAYQDFLAMWKDADANNPLLQQAKAEYSKLN